MRQQDKDFLKKLREEADRTHLYAARDGTAMHIDVSEFDRLYQLATSVGSPVYILEYKHKHGNDISAWVNEDSAYRAAAKVCASFAVWNFGPMMMLTADEAEAMRKAKIEEIRALEATGKYRECVNLYLTFHTGESFEVRAMDVQT